MLVVSQPRSSASARPQSPVKSPADGPRKTSFSPAESSSVRRITSRKGRMDEAASRQRSKGLPPLDPDQGQAPGPSVAMTSPGFARRLRRAITTARPTVPSV